MAKRYSAGRIFLQVVPSFKNLQNDIQRAVNQANSPLEKQQEELGKKHEKARQRGEAKARKAGDADRSARRQTELKEEDAHLQKLFQVRYRWGQVSISERAKQSKRELDQDARNAKRRMDLESTVAKNEIKERARAAKEKQAQDARNAKNLFDLDRRVAEGRIKEEQRAARERQRLSRKNLDLEIADIARAVQQRAKIEAEAERERQRKEERDERARQKIRNRRATQRLNNMRSEERERRRLAGGGTGSMIRKSAQGAADSIGVLKIDADSSPAERRIQALRERLLTLSNTDIGVDMKTGDAMAEIKLLQKELNQLARKSPDVHVEVNAKMALASLAMVERQIDQINRKKATSGFLGMFGGASQGADDGANSFRIFNYRVLALLVLLPMLAPLLASAAGAIGALATAAIGGAAGLGVMIVGFTGLGDAISALGDVQDNAAKDTLANSKAIRTASKGVRDAEQGVADARRNAARAAEQASRRVVEARERVAETEKDVARSIRDALRAQRDAERQLADAQRDATKAQQDLAEARKQAQRDQQDLADKIASGKLDERQALIDLFDAQVAYNAAMADPGATNLEKEQASIGLERARLAIKGIRQENADLAEEQKKGADANGKVADAQERVADTQQRVQDAQQNVIDADERTRDARVEGAKRIADAQQAVADAIQAQSDQAVDSGIQIRNANERLTDAQAAYQEALTKTGDIGSSSMQKLEQAMGKLGPEGQAFARFIFGLRDAFYDIRNIIQAGMLPPLQREIQNLIDTYGPAFKDFIGVMGRTVGDFFTAFGEALRSPVMKTFFETMARYAPIFFTQFGDLFINIMKLIAGLATAFAPFAKEFMDGFVSMSKGWADWAEGLAGSDGFNEFIDYVKTEGPQVLKLIGDIFTIILNIGKGMAETPIFDTIVGFFSFLASLDPSVIATIFTVITGLAFASQVAAGINALAISIGFLMTSALGPWVIGMMLVGVGLVALYKNNEAFAAFVDKTWAWIQDVFQGFLDWIQTSFLPWWSDTLLPFLQGIWDGIVAGVSWFVDFVMQIWNTLAPAFGVVVTAIKWFWDKILFPTFEAIGSFFVHIWQNYLQPTLRVLWEVFSRVFQIVALLITNVVLPVFRLLGTVLKWVWDYVLYPVISSIGNAFSFLWEYIVSPVLRLITDAFKAGFKAVVVVWDTILKPVLDAIIDMLQGDFQGAWENVVKAIGGIWNGLKQLLAAPINFVFDTILNKGLFAAFDKVMEFFGSDLRAPRIPLLTWGEETPAVTGVAWQGSKASKNQKYQFDTGGYTGFGGKFEPAGIVHRDEYVLRKEATNTLMKTIGLGGLDYMNATGQLPIGGFAIGGMVKPVNAAPRFPWGHYPSGRTHRALDLAVPIGTPVVSPFSGTIIRDGWDNTGFGTHVRLAADNGTFWILGHLLREIVSVGQRVLGGTRLGDSGNSGNSTGPHLHLEGRTSPYDPATAFDFTSAFNGGVTRTPPAGKAGVDLPWWADKPLDFLQGIVQAGVDKIPLGGVFGGMLKAFPGKIFGGAREFIANLLGVGGDLDDASGGKFVWNGQEVDDNGTQMFDRGGLLQPGVTQVLNMTGRPEPVFTADQWAQRGGGGGAAALIGHLEQNLNGTDVSATDVVDEIMHAMRVIDHSGKYAHLVRG